MNEYTYGLYEYSERYDYATLQRHLSDSQNLMIRRIERANRSFEKAMEWLDEGQIENPIKK